MPDQENTTVRWQSKPLKINGSWEGIDPPYNVRLYESSKGTIDWHCVHPRAHGTVKLGNGLVLEGLGYVEHLEMTIAPWDLPLQELRWGRFLSDSESLVGIDWRGGHSRRIVLQNGAPRTVTALAENEIVMEENQKLRLSPGKILRTGALGRTALSMIPGVNRLLPGRLLDVQECKWRSRGEFVRGNHTNSGWAIHEVVRWPG